LQITDWVQDRALKGAELVYLISLRSVSSENENLLNILRPFHVSGENARQKLSSHIEKMRGKGVCFILDGFDEYVPHNKEKSLIHALLNRSYLPEAMVILTSHPVAASSILNESHICIEVLGLIKSQIFEYIDNYPFKSSSSPEKLKHFLTSHPEILSMCYSEHSISKICIYCDIGYDLPVTQSKMYELFSKPAITFPLKVTRPAYKRHLDEPDHASSDKISSMPARAVARTDLQDISPVTTPVYGEDLSMETGQ